MVTVNGESCILTLPRDNITFRSIYMKPFYITNKQANIIIPKTTRNGEEGENKNIIIINIPLTKLSLTLILKKRNRDYSRKNPDIIIYL